MKRRGTVFALSLVVSAGGLVPPSHASHSDPKPLTATSWYQDSVSTTLMDSKGCNTADNIDAGNDPTQGIVIFSYGNPVKFSSTQWGASAFGSPDVTTGQIRDAIEAWAAGFNRCLGSLVRPYTDFIVMASTTNNFPGSWTSSDVSGHAQQWANMAKNINTYIVNQGWSNVVTAAAAIDMEMGWAGPTLSRSWADAYSGVTSRRPYYNFGDAAGCQTFSAGSETSCGTASYPGWGSNDVYYISWQASAAYPFPQIYNESGTNAEQWVMINKWALDNSKSLMGIRGPLSQDQACNQVGGCSGIHNTPTQAWTQMVNKMDAKPATIVNMLYSSDIKWQNP